MTLSENSTNSAPSSSKCFRFNVATTSPWTFAVAAIRVSFASAMWPAFRAVARIRPLRSATASFTGRIRPVKFALTCSVSQASRYSFFLPLGSNSTP